MEETMLFYNFDYLDDFIKNDIIPNLKKERETIKEIINVYDNKKNNLLTIINNMLDIADSIQKPNLDEFHKTVSFLKQSLENINFMEELASKLEQELSLILSLYDKSIENNLEEIKANLVEYNKQRDELSQKILEFENTYTSILNSAIELSLKTNRKKVKKQNKIKNNAFSKDTLKVNIELESFDYNILTVSEKDQKAYLPFFYSEIKEIYQNSNDYATLQDVVNNLYIVPLDRFRNSAIARFKESFHLMRNKEKSSITKALDLALELMFKYELNPIVIAACRNLDELDIYLDCLEENELQDFSCFEIKFEVMPKLTKKNTFLF